MKDKVDQLYARDLKSKKALNKNYGYSEAGFNPGLNTYIKSKDHYKRVLREKKAENPEFKEVG